MNVQKIKYAIEVWKCGSISKAAENLFLDQANLSRTIRQLESEYNIRLFNRTSSGVEITSEGILFLREAMRLIENVDSFDQTFKENKTRQLSCRIATMDVTYLAKAVTESLNVLTNQPGLEFEYYETNDTLDIINCVSNSGYHLGIIRLEEGFEEGYQKLLKDKQLVSKQIIQFQYKVLINKNNPLAHKHSISIAELSDYNCLVRGDNTRVRFIDASDNSFFLREVVEKAKNTITLYGRGSQYDFLRNVPDTYMIVSPIPEDVLTANGLVQKNISGNPGGVVEDLLIMQNGYQPSTFETSIISKIIEVGKSLETFSEQ